MHAVMPDVDDDPPEPEASVTVDVGRIGAIGEQVVAANNEWQPGEVIDFGHFKWTPPYVVPGQRVLHVHNSEGMPRFVSRRLRAAAEAGYRVDVALEMEVLYDPEVLQVLSDVDAHVYVVRGDEVEKRRELLAAISDHGVAVEPEARVRMAQQSWDRRGEGNAQERGKRLEALLAFILSQVADLRVFSRNYRNETQEIDIVLQVDNFSARCWVAPGVPFVLVEAKNWAEPAGQPVVSLLIRKLETKRGKVRLGLLFCTGGFTQDAHQEELRLSQTDYCVAMFDAEAIEGLIVAIDLDDYLEKHISDAMLR
jgi:hypothetical protein